MQGDSTARKTRDERVALTGGDAEHKRQRCPGDDGKHGGREGDDGLVGVLTEVYHVGDGLGDLGAEQRHNVDTEEVEYGGHDDGGACRHTTGDDASGDGVGRVRPAVDQNDAQRQKDGYKEERICQHLADKILNFHRRYLVDGISARILLLLYQILL